MFEQKEFIKVKNATYTPWVLIDAVHAQKPNRDLYTGTIAKLVAERTGCHCIIATVSRDVQPSSVSILLATITPTSS